MHANKFSRQILGQRSLRFAALTSMMIIVPAAHAQHKGASYGVTSHGSTNSGPVKAHNEQGRLVAPGADTINGASGATGKSIDAPSAGIEKLLSGDSGGGSSSGPGPDLIDSIDDTLGGMLEHADLPRTHVDPGHGGIPLVSPSGQSLGGRSITSIPSIDDASSGRPSVQTVPAPSILPGMAMLLLARRRRRGS
jgi:hypothetical protein